MTANSIDPATHQTLQAVRNLLSDPAQWTQDFLARDAAGTPIGPHDAQAVAWCLRGAVLRVAATPAAGRDARKILTTVAGDNSLPRYNDTHDHAAVLALLDSAIKWGDHPHA